MQKAEYMQNNFSKLRQSHQLLAGKTGISSAISSGARPVTARHLPLHTKYINQHSATKSSFFKIPAVTHLNENQDVTSSSKNRETNEMQPTTLGDQTQVPHYAESMPAAMFSRKLHLKTQLVEKNQMIHELNDNIAQLKIEHQQLSNE